MHRLPGSALNVLSACALICVLAFAFVGSPLMVQPIVSPDKIRQPEPPEELEFFTDRNRVTIEVPFDMTVGDLVRMYQLEQTRGALLKQMGANENRMASRGDRIEVELMQRLPTVKGAAK